MSEKEEINYGTLFQSILVFGAAVGALSCSYFLKQGKLRLMYATNALLCIGVGISLISDKTYSICIGRFIWGLSIGTFNVISAKFVNEISPIEYKGFFGATLQLSVTLGQCIPSFLGLGIKHKWRFIWSSAILVSIIQVLLLRIFFHHETPVFLSEQGQNEQLLKVMKKFYKETEIRGRLDALSLSKNEGNAAAQAVTIKETFFDPQIRTASWVGFWLVVI